jgi:hypothetical protein
MQKPKVDVLIVLFAYSGNGGIPGTIPEIAMWMAKNVHEMKIDPRIGRVGTMTLCDTPITMTRNRAVAAALAGGFDMLLMLDSDNEPDGYLGRDPQAKPFWEVAFNHAYDRLIAGKPTLIFAPYCGPPPHPVPKAGTTDHGEVPYLFQWTSNESDVEQPAFKLDILTRREAALMRGIHPVAAGPTGVFLMTLNSVEGMNRPLFDYQYNDDWSEKHTTEDVFFTRNCSLFWQHKIGENVCFAACDSWALHHKIKRVGRPVLIGVEHVGKDLVDAVRQNVSVYDEIHHLDLPDLPQRGRSYEDEGLEPEEATELAPSNGHAKSQITYRSVLGRRLKLVDREDPPAGDMQALNQLAEFTAAMAKKTPLPAMPLGSTVYAHPCPEAVKDNFHDEVSTGRVREVDRLDPAKPEEFNLIVTADCLLPGQLDELKIHLHPQGVLAGVAYGDAQTFQEIHDLLDPLEVGARVIDGTSVWAVEAKKLNLIEDDEPVSA